MGIDENADFKSGLLMDQVMDVPFKCDQGLPPLNYYMTLGLLDIDIPRISPASRKGKKHWNNWANLRPEKGKSRKIHTWGHQPPRDMMKAKRRSTTGNEENLKQRLKQLGKIQKASDFARGPKHVQ